MGGLGIEESEALGVLELAQRKAGLWEDGMQGLGFKAQGLGFGV